MFLKAHPNHTGYVVVVHIQEEMGKNEGTLKKSADFGMITTPTGGTKCIFFFNGNY